MSLWEQLIIIIVLVAVATWLSSLIRKYILPRYKIKKLYALIATIVLFVIYILLSGLYQKENFAFLQYVMLLIVCISMMTYFEISRAEREEKNKPVVGRPMPKPHRAKDSQDSK